jgi:hypothetical protein
MNFTYIINTVATVFDTSLLLGYYHPYRLSILKNESFIFHTQCCYNFSLFKRLANKNDKEQSLRTLRQDRMVLHMLKLMQHLHAPIAQMDRASDYESAGRGFESSWARLYQGFTHSLFFL